MSLNKFYNLKVGSEAKSARFVVDLKKSLGQSEPVAVKAGRVDKLEAGLEKLAEVDYKKFFNDKKQTGQATLSKIGAALKTELIPLLEVPKFEIKRFKRVKTDLIDQLAFVALAKFLAAAVYKICYATGWTVSFSLRFIFLIIKALTAPLVRFFYRRSVYLAETANKVFKHVSVAPAAKQELALKASLKLYQRVRRTVENKKAIYSPAPVYQEGIRGYLKPVLVFAGVLLLIILPVKAYSYYRSIDDIKGKVLGASENAILSLLNGGRAAAEMDFNRAGDNFAAAGDNFTGAQKELEEVNGLLFALAAIMPDKNLRLASAGKNILRAGELGASAGKSLSLAVAGVFPENGPVDLVKAINGLKSHGAEAAAKLSQLEKELNKIDGETIPAAYQNQFINLKQKIATLNRGLTQFVVLAADLENFLGLKEKKRYLLVFQNNSELRASGGFIGSYAVIDFSQGEITNIQAPGGGSYDTDAGLLKKIKSPEPLRLVRADWHFWDANWWPDWPTTARKLAWFYENSDGSTVDGVIGLTPTVMEKFLRLIGPVDMTAEYGLIFDADNFWLETQKLAEQKPDVTLKPKKIIGDLLNKIMAELPERLNKSNLAGLLRLLEESLNDKNLLFYLADPNLEAKLKALGWDGGLKATDGDYLNVINTNIAGGKSDRRVSQEIIHQAEVQSDGAIIDDLTIRRTHNGIKREPFSGVRNVDWLRIYVPAGAELISAQGFKPVDKIFFKTAEAGWQNDPDVFAAESSAQTEPVSGTKIYSELGKTVFANWSQLDPGETVEIRLKYRLPFKFTDQRAGEPTGRLDELVAAAGELLAPEQKNLYAYSLLAQKQPGMNSSTLKSEFKLSPGFKIVWQYPGGSGVDPTGWSYAEIFNQDKLTAVMAAVE